MKVGITKATTASYSKMRLEQPKFLQLAHEEKIFTPLKSFSDSLLFYFIGTLSLDKEGELLEIGCGGSTYIMYELSSKFHTTLTVCDLKEMFINAHVAYYENANVNPIIGYSNTLSTYNIGPIVYAHVDGDKNYNTTLEDLEYCINNLAPFGIICQDDYGNNKWPSITQAVMQLVAEDKVKIILVGDSSVWLTAPEYYDYWMTLVSSDREFNILGAYLGLQNSNEILGCDPNYLFINTLNYAPAWVDQIYSKYDIVKDSCTQIELDTLSNIHKYKDSPRYLKMPYYGQSSPGIWLN